MTTPDETPETRWASSGGSRTPPPRPRRGSPTGRTTTVDDLDDLLLPEQRAALAEPVEPGSPESDDDEERPKPVKKRGAPPVDSGVAAGAGETTTKAFDWDSIGDGDWARSSTTNRDAVMPTTAPVDDFGDPLEPEVAAEPAAAPRPAKVKPAKRPERRFRQTVQKVDLWSVTKMALCFYVSAMGVVVVSLIALWVVAESAGIIDNVENFVGDLFSSEDFEFVSAQVLRGAVLVGVVLVALMVAFTIIAASFYNIFAELFGGVEIVIREEEQPPKR